MSKIDDTIRFDSKYKAATTLYGLGADIINVGVTTKETFVNALIAMRQADEEIEKLEKAARELAKVGRQLSEDAAKYAEEHALALDTGLVEGPDGTRTGTLRISDDGDGYNYHLVVGKDKPKRASGDKITQSFLASLPQEWVNSKLELSLTKVAAHVHNTEAERLEEHPNATPKSVDDYLATHGMIRPVKRTWTVSPM